MAIRVNPEDLFKKSNTISGIGSQFQDISKSLNSVVNDAPSYNGQFRPVIIKICSETFSRAEDLQQNILNESSELSERALKFLNADRMSAERIDVIRAETLNTYAVFEEEQKKNQLLETVSTYTVFEEEQERKKAEEKKEREKKATIAKWALTGLCIVGGIAATVLTGGAAAPLVMGAVSAVTGAVLAGGNAAIDQYVEHGSDIGKWDKGKIIGDAFVGGVSGFITGSVGSAVSGSISTSLLKTGFGQMLTSTNTLTRVGANALVGAASQVVSGVATRGTSTFAVNMLTGNDLSTSWNAAKKAASDKDQMIVDAALGGASGAIKGLDWKKTRPNYSENKDIYDDAEYFNQKTGEPHWAPNDGFKDNPKTVTLKKGTLVDRYGYDSGKFTADVGTPWNQRSISPDTQYKPYVQYEILGDIEGVKVGEIAGWFGQPGGGNQQVFPEPISYYIEKGLMRVVYRR